MFNSSRNAVVNTSSYMDGFLNALRGGPQSTLSFLFATRQGLTITVGGGAVILFTYLLLTKKVLGSHRSIERQPSFEGGSGFTVPQVSNPNKKIITPQDYADLDSIVHGLHSHSADKVSSALADLYRVAGDKKQFPAIQEKNVVHKLLELLAEHARNYSQNFKESSFEDLQNLLRIFNYIASAQGKLRTELYQASPDLIRIISSGYLQNLKRESNSSILENSLRVLMHLSVDSTMEVELHKQGAIPPVLALMESSNTDLAPSIQAARLLINLAFNPVNKRTIIDERGVEIASTLLKANLLKWRVEKEKRTEVEEYVVKLIRILGFLSGDVDLKKDEYEAIVSEHLAKAIVEVLESKDAKDKDSDFVIGAVKTILKKGKELNDQERFLSGLREGKLSTVLDKFRGNPKTLNHIDEIKSALEA